MRAVPPRLFTLPALLAVSAFAQTAVPIPFACTAGDIEHFGLNCTAEQPCPVYADLNFVESVGARVFLTGNLHTESVTLYSLLFASEDSGASWKEVYDRVQSGNLDQIQFLDFQNGWISGGLLMGLPRDPFFLVTHDGGQTWRDRPVFDEGRIGTITEFWFDDKSSGQLVLDHTRKPENGNRYELHETMTGGDTWMPKQLSPKPLKLAHSHPGSEKSGWRLSPDAKTKTTHVEVERAGQWEAVAIFPIRVADCKPPEPKPEPQP
jgi:photosystem II stability/assembly factor-like uncharacterized protein